MKFLDEAKIYVRSGNGGAGCVSFRREKFIEFGGPDGGDGGRGGDIVFQAVHGLNTLIDFRYRQHFKAQSGIHGAGRQRFGVSGEDLIIDVPVGTQILSEEKNVVLFDFTHVGQRFVLAKGGRGGKGNAFFKSSTQQAPRYAQPGEEGQECWVWLRLKLMADIGLVGLPNAGKSTLLSVLSRANPKIADYPFTTLYPHLGVVRYDHGGSEVSEWIMADLPGLIEGAHEGKGLGHRFLGHVERCKMILHLVDATSENPEQSYQIIQDELRAYGHGLAEKKQHVVFNKVDAVDAQELQSKIRMFKKLYDIEPLIISAATRQGIPDLLHMLRVQCTQNLS